MDALHPVDAASAGDQRGGRSLAQRLPRAEDALVEGDLLVDGAPEHRPELLLPGIVGGEPHHAGDAGTRILIRPPGVAEQPRVAAEHEAARVALHLREVSGEQLDLPAHLLRMGYRLVCGRQAARVCPPEHARCPDEQKHEQKRNAIPVAGHVLKLALPVPVCPASPICVPGSRRSLARTGQG